MLDRWDLKLIAVSDVSVPGEKLEKFIEAIGLEGVDLGEGTSICFETFMNIFESKVDGSFTEATAKPVILDALAERAEDLFLKE